MRIVYTISEEDFMGAYDLYVAGEKWYRRWSRRMMPWEGGLFLIIGITSLVLTRDRALPGFLFLMGAYFLYCGFALRRYFRKRYRTDQRYRHDFSAEITEEGIHFVTVFEDTQMKWGSVIRYSESDRIFMLFHSALIFTIIPKRAFGPGDADMFRELLCRGTAVL